MKLISQQVGNQNQIELLYVFYFFEFWTTIIGGCLTLNNPYGRSTSSLSKNWRWRTQTSHKTRFSLFDRLLHSTNLFVFDDFEFDRSRDGQHNQTGFIFLFCFHEFNSSRWMWGDVVAKKMRFFYFIIHFQCATAATMATVAASRVEQKIPFVPT